MSSDTIAAFDSANEVPDEYDIFCEACSYSLVGLTGDRCPECGTAFEPKALPFARIPWLHRKRLGKVNAYVKTVLMVCFRPRQFATEICRPVRISANDARRFRLTTLWITTLVSALIPCIVMGVEMINELILRSQGRVFMPQPVRIVALAILCVLGMIVAFHFFLRLATDMPLFIWKGHPSLSPHELAPIHHYACAPLALLPPVLLIETGLAYMLSVSTRANEGTIVTIAIVLGCLVPAWLLMTALIFMHISARPGAKRLSMLAVYMPVHWLIMFAVSGMTFAVFVRVSRMAFGYPDQ